MNTGDTAFVLLCAAFVFFMTPGLAFFYGGLVRRKNVCNTMMACVSIMGLSIVMWALFGYSLATPDAGRYGKIGDMEYSSRINPEIYCVESPDGLKAAGHDSGIWMTFPDSHLGAAVWNDSGNFRTVSLTVPLETFLSETDRTSVLGAVMRWFIGEGSSPTCTT